MVYRGVHVFFHRADTLWIRIHTRQATREKPQNDAKLGVKLKSLRLKPNALLFTHYVPLLPLCRSY